MKSILVVDDSHTVRQLILACLEGDHFTVEEAEDGVAGRRRPARGADD